MSNVPDNCAPLNHWSYHVGHWLHRHIIHWFMASNCSKIKCPCCIMDTPLVPSPLKPAPPLIQTLLVVHCQQTCVKEIRAGEYSTHKCAEEPGPSDADVYRCTSRPTWGGTRGHCPRPRDQRAELHQWEYGD